MPPRGVPIGRPCFLQARPISSTSSAHIEEPLCLSQTFQQAIDFIGQWGYPQKNLPLHPHPLRMRDLFGVVNLWQKLRASACCRQPLNLSLTLSTHWETFLQPAGEAGPWLGNEGPLRGGRSLSNSLCSTPTPRQPHCPAHPSGPRGRPCWPSCRKG